MAWIKNKNGKTDKTCKSALGLCKSAPQRKLLQGAFYFMFRINVYTFI